jgi:hypothetical protein
MIKKCTKCHCEKPATVEFFYVNKIGKEKFNPWCKECHKQYRRENAAKIKKTTKNCKEKNPEKYRQLKKQWFAANKDKKRMYRLDYLARKKNRKPVWFGELDAFVMSEAHNLANLRKHFFGFQWSVDHVIPMRGKKVSGLHVYNNVQVIPSAVNSQKHNSYEVQ